jgi:hypothetical protein
MTAIVLYKFHIQTTGRHTAHSDNQVHEAAAHGTFSYIHMSMHTHREEGMG